ncbi:hypothetical protein GCM10009672_16500 [Nesterenkonia lutea]
MVFSGTLGLLFIPQGPDQLAVPAIVPAVIIHSVLPLAVLLLAALRLVIRRSGLSLGGRRLRAAAASVLGGGDHCCADRTAGDLRAHRQANG